MRSLDEMGPGAAARSPLVAGFDGDGTREVTQHTMGETVARWQLRGLHPARKCWRATLLTHIEVFGVTGSTGHG